MASVARNTANPNEKTNAAPQGFSKFRFKVEEEIKLGDVPADYQAAQQLKEELSYLLESQVNPKAKKRIRFIIYLVESNQFIDLTEAKLTELLKFHYSETVSEAVDRCLGLLAECPGRAVLSNPPAPETKSEATVEISVIIPDNTSLLRQTEREDEWSMDDLRNAYLAALRITQPFSAEKAAKLDAYALALEKDDVVDRAATPKPAVETIAAANTPIKKPLADLTPQQIAALTADTTLGRLQARYEKMLQEITLPEGEIKDVEKARAAGSLVVTYKNLVKQQKKAGLEPEPKDERVMKAQRLSVAFYRKKRAGNTPPQRRRPPKSAENSLA